MNNVLMLPEAVDKLSDKQKVVAGGLSLGVAGLVCYYVLPPVIVIFTNLYILGALLFGIYCIYHLRFTLWGFFKSISWYLTQRWIGLDIFSARERYYEWFCEKLEKTKKAKDNLSARLYDLDNQITKAEGSRNEALKRANISEKQNLKVEVDVLLEQAKGLEDFVRTLLPIRDVAKENVKYLEEAVDAVSATKRKLRNDFDISLQKHNALKAMYEGMTSAKDVLTEDNEMAKIFAESEKQLNQRMNLYTAQINSLEQTIKPALESSKLDRQLAIEEGRKLLDEFRRANNQ